jgi:hypothetical protein
MVFPLKEEGTTRMICSGVPQGWFRSALCYVIDFDKGIPFSAINALPKALLTPAGSCILKWLGYKTKD